jgi:hypothetical protein
MFRFSIREMMLVMLVVALLVGCGSGESGLSMPDTLTLYSIDGTYLPGDMPKKYEGNAKFRGIPILGELEVKDADSRREIMTALKNGIGKDNGTRPGCFWPRHAIRARENGKTIDYVICFECHLVQIVTGDGSEGLPIKETPKDIFNKHLSEANVPLTP